MSRYRELGKGFVAARELVIGNLPFGADHVSRTIEFNPSREMYISVVAPCNAYQESFSKRAATAE